MTAILSPQADFLNCWCSGLSYIWLMPPYASRLTPVCPLPNWCLCPQADAYICPRPQLMPMPQAGAYAHPQLMNMPQCRLMLMPTDWCLFPRLSEAYIPLPSWCLHFIPQLCISSSTLTIVAIQGRSESFWRPGRRLQFGAPPPPTSQKNWNSPKFAKSLKLFTKFG